MLKRIRQVVALAAILMVTLIFLDFTGLAREWFGWLAKIQFLPALLALNLGIVAFLVVLTLIFGRLYCSVICPLGVMQDGFAWLGKKAKKNRYTYSRPKNILRYVMFAVMVIAIIAGIGVVVRLLAPYSAYGRIATTFLEPVWIWFNNRLALWAEAHGSYAFHNEDFHSTGWIVAGVAVVTLMALAILAWRNGRTYCNTICPVGTTLGFLSRFSLFRPVIDKSKCVNCGLCSKNCKSSCIDLESGKIDYSRCVTCYDCISECRRGAISYTYRRDGKTVENQEGINTPRRQFLTLTASLAAGAALNAAEKTVDGGLAAIEEKKIPTRATKIVPPGAKSLRNMATHCTACQLCVSACPNGVLRPSSDLATLMQPESSFEKGYCRPECTRCSEACPAGAILPVTREEKSSIQVGHAVWIKENCVPLREGVECGNCARHCPVGAIMMVDSGKGVDIPVVNVERCIGCGACENLCPSRPFSAIYVEGHENHRIV